jgi:hypothetical protein
MNLPSIAVRWTMPQGDSRSAKHSSTIETLWPSGAFRLRRAGLGATLGSLTVPRVGLAVPVGPRGSGLVWRDWACHAGASALMPKLRLFLLSAYESRRN